MQKCPRFQSSNWFETPDGELAYIKFSNKMNAQKTQLATVMDFHGSFIAFKEINGKMMINATQMANLLVKNQ